MVLMATGSCPIGMHVFACAGLATAKLVAKTGLRLNIQMFPFFILRDRSGTRRLSIYIYHHVGAIGHSGQLHRLYLLSY